MSAIGELLDRLWSSPALKRDAREAAENVNGAALRQLEDIVELLRERSVRRGAKGNIVPQAFRSDPLRAEQIAGLLELLMLASFHSDTLLYLSREEREGRLLTWAQRTGFHPDLVREAATLGPAGIGAFLKAP